MNYVLNFQEKIDVKNTLDFLQYPLLHSVHPRLSAGGVEPPTKFSRRGAWQDLNFQRGVTFVRGGGGWQYLQKVN